MVTELKTDGIATRSLSCDRQSMFLCKRQASTFCTGFRVFISLVETCAWGHHP